MRRGSTASIAFLACLWCLPEIARGAVPPPEGRWEGQVEIPGNELRLVVDLAQGSGGAWSGSIVIPGLGIKGVALSNIVATDTDVSFDLGKVLGSPTQGPARFNAHLTSPDRVTGEMRQAGNVAKFALARSGQAHVEASPRSTPVGRDLEDRWIGEYELGGYPRHVTLALENHAAAGASAKLVIIGKATNDIPVDLVVQNGDSLRIESQATGIAFEGRIGNGASEIRGTIELGSIELPLVLRRGGKPS
jgi:hypothetical protein